MQIEKYYNVQIRLELQIWMLYVSNKEKWTEIKLKGQKIIKFEKTVIGKLEWKKKEEKSITEECQNAEVIKIYSAGKNNFITY